MTAELATIEQPGSAAGTHALAMLSDDEFKLRLESLKQGRERIAEIQRRLMRPGVDFGKIPGTGDRPTLLKPGAEKLADFYQLAAGMAADMTPGDGERTPLIRYEVRCTLHLRTLDGPVVASGWGVCTSHEKKYRYRNEWSGNGPTRTKQRVVNDDPWEQANTILKIAEKRAFIDAVLRATASSGLFTQDVGDDDLPADPVRTNPNPAPELPDRASKLRKALIERATARNISAADLDFIAAETFGSTVADMDAEQLTRFGQELVAGSFDREPIESSGQVPSAADDSGSAPAPEQQPEREQTGLPATATMAAEPASGDMGTSPEVPDDAEPEAGPSLQEVLDATGGELVPSETPRLGTDQYKALDARDRAAARAYWQRMEPAGARETAEAAEVPMGL